MSEQTASHGGKQGLAATVGFRACLIAYANVAECASSWAHIEAEAPAAADPPRVWILYDAGFVATGGDLFSMWQSAVWNGQGKAVTFVTRSALALVVLRSSEDSD